MKTFLTITAVIVLIVGGLYIWMFPESLGNLFGGKEEEVVIPEEPVNTTSTYASTTLGISLSYPSNFILSEDYTNDAFGATKLIHGISLRIPAAMATGTNLSSDTYISVEWLPRALNCTGDIYLKANVKAKEVTEGSTTFSLATSSEGAAGNVYEEWAYAIKGSKPCTAVRYFIHSSNIGNYPAGSVQEFNKAALLASFDEIRRSLRLGSTATPPATTSSQVQP